MKGNMGVLDRIIRVALVAVVGVLYFTGQLTLVASVILGALAVIVLLTSIIGVCPLYLPFGLSTKRKPAA